MQWTLFGPNSGQAIATIDLPSRLNGTTVVAAVESHTQEPVPPKTQVDLMTNRIRVADEWDQVLWTLTPETENYATRSQQ